MSIVFNNIRKNRKGILFISTALTGLFLASNAPLIYASDTYNNDTISIKVESSSSQIESLIESNDVNLISPEDANYANEHCDGNTFVKKVAVGVDDDLWQTVDSYIQKSGSNYSHDYWVKFTNSQQIKEPWTPRGNSKVGVLFILPQDSIYATQTQLADWGNSLEAPRFGLCALNYAGQGSVAQLELHGDNSKTDSEGRTIRKAPLYVEQAQIEVFGVKINADKVDPSIDAIWLYDSAKLLLTDVSLTRTANDINNNSTGLIGNRSSYISLMRSKITQSTNKGKMFSISEEGIFRCNGDSVLSVSQNVDTFLGSESMFGFETCIFNSQAPDDSDLKPVFFTDIYDTLTLTYCNAKEYLYCKQSKNPNNDAPPSAPKCNELIKECYAAANHIKMTDNTFTGNWNYIFRSRWSDFPSQVNNKFATDSDDNKLGTVGMCSDLPSFSIKGGFYFDDEVCVPEMKW